MDPTILGISISTDTLIVAALIVVIICGLVWLFNVRR